MADMKDSQVRGKIKGTRLTGLMAHRNTEKKQLGELPEKEVARVRRAGD